MTPRMPVGMACASWDNCPGTVNSVFSSSVFICSRDFSLKFGSYRALGCVSRMIPSSLSGVSVLLRTMISFVPLSMMTSTIPRYCSRVSEWKSFLNMAARDMSFAL